ncbi:ATP-dependent RNA helicase RhlE [Streptomyces griseoloalbus]
MPIASTDHVVVPENTEDTDTTAVTGTTAPEITFASLGLPEGVVRKLAQNGVTTPFPIQAATIPDALAGKDILGRGRTGSGKTLSFGLPTLAQLAGGRTEKHKPRAVILTPTRELAMQVADALQPYGDVLGLKMKVVCGGTSMGNQIYALERGVDVLVATPGRLRDIINRGACSLENVEIAVLDEADQMSDLGFMPEVTELLDQVPAGGQRMLFSATMENEIKTLVDRYLDSPVSHEVDAAQGAVTTMSHHILVVKPKDKAPVTAAIASRKGRTIIFVRTQLGADRVAEQLRDSGVKAEALHGGMTQGARTRTLADFKDGYVNVARRHRRRRPRHPRRRHRPGAERGPGRRPQGLPAPRGPHRARRHAPARSSPCRCRTSGARSSASWRTRASTPRATSSRAARPSTRRSPRSPAPGRMTEVQAESAGNAAQQAEREVAQLTKELERAQRRATELREEADRLLARAARERGDDPQAVIAEAAAVVAEAEVALPEQPTARDVERTEPVERPAASAPYERRDDRGDRGGFNRDRDRGDRGGFRRDDRRDDRGGRSFDRRDDRGDRGGFNRDRDRGDRGGFRRDDRGGRSFDRRDGGDRGGFRRDDRDDRGGRSFERRDDRGDRGGFNRDRDRGDRGGFRRDDRRDDRGGRSFDRRDDRGDRGDRGGFNRDRDRGDRGGFRRDDRPGHRGSDRPFNRDRQGDRPGFRVRQPRPPVRPP